jgi:hypothetical protein
LCGYFRDRVLWITCLGWPQTSIFLTSAFQVARNIGVSHQHPEIFLKSIPDLRCTHFNLWKFNHMKI